MSLFYSIKRNFIFPIVSMPCIVFVKAFITMFIQNINCLGFVGKTFLQTYLHESDIVIKTNLKQNKNKLIYYNIYH